MKETHLKLKTIPVLRIPAAGKVHSAVFCPSSSFCVAVTRLEIVALSVTLKAVSLTCGYDVLGACRQCLLNICLRRVKSVFDDKIVLQKAGFVFPAAAIVLLCTAGPHQQLLLLCQRNSFQQTLLQRLLDRVIKYVLPWPHSPVVCSL